MASQSVRPPLRGDMSARQAMVLESAYGNNTPVKPAEEIGRLAAHLAQSIWAFHRLCARPTTTLLTELDLVMKCNLDAKSVTTLDL